MLSGVVQFVSEAISVILPRLALRSKTASSWLASCVALTTWAVGCGGTSICATNAACSNGATCQQGKCVPGTSTPDLERTQRVILVPDDMTVLRSRAPGSAAPTDEVAFGRRRDGTTTMLLHFPLALGRDADVREAYLVLTPARGHTAGQAPVELHISPITEVWSSRRVQTGQLPELSAFSSKALASTWSFRRLRVDVTDLLRTWGHDPTFHGLAVSASAQDDEGAWYYASAAGGAPPRLELYVR